MSNIIVILFVIIIVLYFINFNSVQHFEVHNETEVKIPVKTIRIENIPNNQNYLQLAQIVIKDIDGNNIVPTRVRASEPWEEASNTNKAIDGVEQVRSHPDIYHSKNDTNVFYELTIPPSNISSITIYQRDGWQDRLQAFQMLLIDANNRTLHKQPLSADPIQTYHYKK